MSITNRPGQDELHWRVAPHGAALARMRAHLAAPDQDLRVRSLAAQDDDPAVALLDTWAVVTDIVSFYTERIAQEGFLRTATETMSVRQQARTLGYELRPGVAAEVELVFETETAPGAPETVVVPAGTPVQTVPAPGKLPQTFETVDELEARTAWNAVPAADRVRQPFGFGTTSVWLSTTDPLVRVDDRLLIIGSERAGVQPGAPHSAATEQWDFRRVVAVETDPPHAAGWTRLDLDEPVGFEPRRPLAALEDVRVYRLARRLNLFGWNAPDPGLLGTESTRVARLASEAAAASWPGAGLAGGTLDVEGDVPDLVPGSWLVLEQPGTTEAYQAVAVTPGGARRFALAGKVTQVTVDLTENLSGFQRDRTLVHAVSQELPTAWMPRPGPVGAWSDGAGILLEVAMTEPALPAGRLVLVEGVRSGDGGRAVEAATVTAVQAAPDGALRLTLDPPLAHSYHAGTVVVHGNVARATHGETAEQVLGSGDGRVAFPRFVLRRPPLTFVRSTTDATGASAELEIRVEGVAWTEVPTLHDAGPRDQVYVVRQGEEGETTVIFGDGEHGSRLPTGTENVHATYRVGIGADGAAEPGQVMLPVRRPRGIARVANLAATRDWAPPEDLAGARVNAPQRIRTLDRAVSVADHEDFARGWSGVGRARADLVWDGKADTVVLSVLDATGAPASGQLLADLRTTLDAAREARARRALLPGQVIGFRVALDVAVDPRYETGAVLEAVAAAVRARHGDLDLAAPLAAAVVLVTAAGVAGVSHATMPVLAADLADAGSAGSPGAGDLLVAAPARWASSGGLLPAQALHLTDIHVGVIA
ncbi:hypothetical protein [Myceligenerans crystallogenes]|uniref:Baseplate assembly protein n=1 Tax=Myceligenerans crystallogenes TaxID=316335 RepID=A0ABP4ZK07_9MICO